MLLCIEDTDALAENAARLAAMLAELYDGDCLMAELLERRGLPGAETPTWQNRAALGWSRLLRYATVCEHPECFWLCYQYYHACFEAVWNATIGKEEAA